MKAAAIAPKPPATKLMGFAKPALLESEEETTAPEVVLDEDGDDVDEEDDDEMLAEMDPVASLDD